MTILVRIQNMKKIVKKKPQIFPLKQKKNNKSYDYSSYHTKFENEAKKKIFSFRQNNNISDEKSNTNSKDDKE